MKKKNLLSRAHHLQGNLWLQTEKGQEWKRILRKSQCLDLKKFKKKDHNPLHTIWWMLQQRNTYTKPENNRQNFEKIYLHRYLKKSFPGYKKFLKYTYNVTIIYHSSNPKNIELNKTGVLGINTHKQWKRETLPHSRS